MSIENRKRDALSMGYREMRAAGEKSAVWGKPVGNVLLTLEFTATTARFTNWFNAADTGKPIIWESEVWFDETHYLDGTAPGAFLSWLKMTEAHTRYATNNPSAFEFASLEEVLLWEPSS